MTFIKILKLFISLLSLSAICLAQESEKKLTEKRFTLNSPDIKEGEILDIEQVYNGFGCTGKNISPELSWQNAPSDTKSFAITAYDPDAPTGSGWWHWSAFNISSKVNKIEKGAQFPTTVVEGKTDFGTSEYGGACPPKGDKPHRYIFTIYALDTEEIALDKNAPGAKVGFYLNKHVIDKATITAKYSR